MEGLPWVLLCVPPMWTNTKYKRWVNPFFFIRGLSCPRSVQLTFTQNCPKLIIPGFSYNLLPVSCDIGFFNNKAKVMYWPQSIFTAFRALLPSANYSAEWSGLVWQPALMVVAVWRNLFWIWSTANSKFRLQEAATPDLESSKSKEASQMAIFNWRAVALDWMARIALWGHIKAFFQGQRKPVKA